MEYIRSKDCKSPRSFMGGRIAHMYNLSSYSGRSKITLSEAVRACDSNHKVSDLLGTIRQF